MVKEGEDHHTVFLFTKENMDSDKPFPVANIPPERLIGGPSKQGRIGNIQGEWDPYISVSVVTSMSVPVEEALSYIGMISKRSVINLECDFEEDWLKSLEEGWRTQSVDQWVEWLTRPAP